MQHFIINSSICLFVLWLIYKLLLENTSWHSFKRFYLLGALVISILIPFIVVKTVVVPLPSFQSLPVQTYDQVEQISIDAAPANDSFSIDWNLVLLAFYGIGFMVMLFRFMKNITGLRLKSTDQTETYQGCRLVLRSKVVVPHHFGTRFMWMPLTIAKVGFRGKFWIMRKHTWISVIALISC